MLRTTVLGYCSREGSGLSAFPSTELLTTTNNTEMLTGYIVAYL